MKPATAWWWSRGTRRGATKRLNGNSCSAVHVLGAPRVELGAIVPGPGHLLAHLGSGDPGLDVPAPEVDEPFVLQQLAARVVLRVGRRHSLELPAADLVTLLELGDNDGLELFAGFLRGDRGAISRQLGRLDRIAPTGHHEALRVQRHVAAAAG